MRRHFPRLTLIFFLALVSCQKTADREITPDIILFEIVGDGCESTAELGAGDWRIIGVINKEGDKRMFGNAYTLEGELISENRPLELDGLGMLESFGENRGGNIIHQVPGSIHVSLPPSGSGRVYSFVIVLFNGHETRGIAVEQPQSAGYSFERIDYYLDEGDRDSIYVRRNAAEYAFNQSTAQSISLNPIAGTSTVNSFFESDECDAFSWLVEDEVEVPIPANIFEGDISFSEQKRVYGAISNEPYESNMTITLPTPTGQSRFVSDIEWRHRRVSYELTMTSKSGGESKVVLGKWIETSPTDVYEIRQIE